MFQDSKRGLNLSIGKGVVRGVAFSPVLRDKCWVGEGETTDPAALAFFADRPESYVIVAEAKPKLDPLLNPSQLEIITAAARAEKLEIVVQGNAQEPMHAEGVQDDPQSVAVTPPLTVTSGWPEGLDKEIIAHLVAAEWTPEDVKAARDAQLEALKGIGRASVKKIRLVLPQAK